MVYDIVFRLLAGMDPEAAQKWAVRAASLGMVPAAPPVEGGGVRMFGKYLPNRIGLAAGADKNALGMAGWEEMGFGFVEAGSVLPYPHDGNPRPRIWRVDGEGMVNWMGLPSHGSHAVARNLEAYRARYGDRFCVGANVATGVELAKASVVCLSMAQQLRDYVDYFTYNVSCPNTAAHASVADAIGRPVLDGLDFLKRGARGRPVLVKLGPTQDDDLLARMVETLLQHGADGFVLCNTVPWPQRAMLEAPPDPWPTDAKGHAVGGYSGPQLFRIALGMVITVRMVAGPDVPIIGVGGIGSALHALTMLRSGADLVQVYTALTYGGPRLLQSMVAGTADALRHDI